MTHEPVVTTDWRARIREMLALAPSVLTFVMAKPNPFNGFETGPEIIHLAALLYVRFPLSLRNVEDLLHERGST